MPDIHSILFGLCLIFQGKWIILVLDVPADFMYQLSVEEFESLNSHFATLKRVGSSIGQ
jgi:hypothetical protein